MRLQKKLAFVITLLLMFGMLNGRLMADDLPDGLTEQEFDNAFCMANLSARVYDALWDNIFDALAPTYFPQIDFVGNTSQYEVVDHYLVEEFRQGCDGFDAKLYHHVDTDSYVLAFRGTEPLSPFDWISDIAQVLKDFIDIKITQYEKAVDLTVVLQEQYGDMLQLTGHSLGGGLAQVAGLATGLKTTCFEAAGTTEGTLNELGITQDQIEKNIATITHFNVKNDPLSDFDGEMNNKAPFDITLRYGTDVYWLESLKGTEGIYNPLRLLNHFYQTFVYKMSKKAFISE